MSKFDVHFASARTGEPVQDTRTTPTELFEALDAEFNFVVDAAANTENFLCFCFYGPGAGMGEDALSAEWAKDAAERCGAVWCNPPYSRLREFLAKGRAESDKGATVVFLIPARTDTRGWHESIFDGHGDDPSKWRAEVRFLPGRVKFGGMTTGAPFPSAVVIFRPKKGR